LLKPEPASALPDHARLQNLAANVPAMLYEYQWQAATNVTTFSYVSPGCRDLLGIEPDFFQHAQLADWIHADDLSGVKESIALSAKTLQPWEREWRIVRRDGETRWVKSTARPQQQPNGDILWSGLIVDITTAKQEDAARRDVEAALRQSQATLVAIQKLAHIGSWEFDATTQTVNWSEETFRIFGLDPTQPAPRYDEHLKLIHPDDATLWTQQVEQSLSHGKPCEFDYRVLQPNGSIRYVYTQGQPVLNQSGQVVRLFGTLLDVTERKQAELALRQANEDLELRVQERTSELWNVVQQLQTEIVERERALHERRESAAALQQSEARFRELAQQEELVNCLASQIRASLDLDTILETAVRSIQELLQIDRCSFLWYRPDLPEPAWEVVKEAKSDALDHSLGLYPTTLTAVMSEKSLNLETIQIDDVATFEEPVLRQILSSVNCTSLLAVPFQTYVGAIGVLNCSHFNAPRPWNPSEVVLLQAVVDQLAIAIDQAELYAQSRSRTDRLEQALEELQRTQSQLVQTEKMSSLGQLVAGVAHEINNPVNFIHGNLTHATDYTKDLLSLLDLYQAEYPDPPPVIQAELEEIDLEFLVEDLPKLLSSMKVGTDRIREIVQSLRHFSRLDQAEMKFVNLHEGLDSTLMILQNRLKARPEYPGIKVTKDYGELPLVECYAGQINQVFMNILSNAIDALEESVDLAKQPLRLDALPHLAIQIQTEVVNGETIVVRIGDNGSGIPPEVQQRLFDPFFTTKPVGKGTGLGLSISYQIVTEKHGGQLRCVSSPASGTTFIIEIPFRQTELVEETSLEP